MMTMLSYEEWLEGLTSDELQEAYMMGGGDDDVALMRAYWIESATIDDINRDNQKDDEAEVFFSK